MIENLSVSELKKVVEALKEIKGPLAEKAIAAVKGVTRSTVELGKNAALAAKNVMGLGEATFNLTKLKGKLNDLKNLVGDYSKNNAEATVTIKNAALALGGALTGMNQVSGGFKDMSEQATRFGTGVVRSGDIATKVLSKVGLENNKLFKIMQDVAKGADTGKGMELSLMRRAAAAGHFTTMLGATGEGVDNLDKAVIGFTQDTAALGNATGMMASDVAKALDLIKEMPNHMKNTSIAALGVAGSMNFFEAATKLASGTGQELSDVLQTMNSAYLDLGISGEAALKYISNMSTAANQLQMPLDIVQKYTKSAGDQFKFFGDNTRGAIEIMGRFSASLKKSKIGPQAISGLVGGVISGIKGMGVAQRAFTSQMSGGPGGLRGAFKMSLELEKGGIGAVFKDIETSLKKQFGGRIVGLEEAAATEAGAAQYQKQILLLTQGPNKIAGSEREAQLILKAMKEGKMDPNLLKDANKSMGEQLSVGNSIQERHTTELVQMNNTLQQIEVATSVAGQTTERRMFGSESGRADAIQARRESATESGVERGMERGAWWEKIEAQKDAIGLAAGAFDTLATTGKDFVTAVTGGGPAADIFIGAINKIKSSLFSSEMPEDSELVEKKAPPALPAAGKRPAKPIPEAVGPGGASAGGGALVPGARPGARAGTTAGPPATQEIKVKVVCETCNTALVNKVIKGKTDVVAARNAGVGV